METFIPFTYLVKFVSPIDGTVLYYYGVRYAKGCHPGELFTTYFTSSDKIHALLKEFGLECFSWEVRKLFPGQPVVAHAWEVKVLRRLKTMSRKDFLNAAIGGTGNVLVGEKNPFFGKTHTPEVCEILRIVNTGKKHTEESSEKKRKALEGRKQDPEFVERRLEAVRDSMTPEVREHMRLSKTGSNNPRYGIPVLEETRQRMRDAQAEQLADKVPCEKCGLSIARRLLGRHQKSKNCGLRIKNCKSCGVLFESDPETCYCSRICFLRRSRVA